MTRAASVGITRRSLVIGTLCVIAVCGVTPLNDLILNDTSLAAGFVPLAAVLIAFLLVVGVNAPLHRWFPSQALATNELAVILMMTLVACSIPNWGLMRFFIPMPVAPFHLGAADEQYWRAFSGMNLPKWLFPVASVHDGRSDPVVTWFYTRVPRGEHIPWSAWIVPLASWGVFIAAMFATIVAVSRIVLEQWASNERLPYPLVQVQAALIEPPAAGRALNDLFRSPLLWIALGSVFALHMLTLLNTYSPRHFPKVPLQYDLQGILSEEPWYYLKTKLKKNGLFFTVVGVTYFIRSRAALSLWLTFILVNLVDVQQGMQQTEMPSQAWGDQQLGASVAFLIAMLWIGRQQWIRVIKSAFGRGNAPGGRSVWTALIGIIVMIAWLKLVGVSPGMALLIVAIIIAAHIVVARVVAETGLPFFRTSINAPQIYTNFPVSWFSAPSVWFSHVFNVLGPITTRDSLAVTTQIGLETAENAQPGMRTKRGMGRAIGWTLLIGCLVAGPMTLYCQYSYPTPSSAEAKPARNYFGAEYSPKRDVANPFTDFSRGRFTGKPHKPALHMGIGFGVTTLLEIASLRWASWPLLPVGYVASYGAFLENAWFSIFIGWLAQLLIVRFGGANLFQRLKPVFIGMIFGEALAAGVWLLVNAILVMNGFESQPVKFLL
jgi:hypothetical protein